MNPIDVIKELDLLQYVEFLTMKSFWAGMIIGLGIQLQELCALVVKFINKIPNKPVPFRTYLLRILNQIAKGFDKAIPDEKKEDEL